MFGRHLLLALVLFSTAQALSATNKSGAAKRIDMVDSSGKKIRLDISRLEVAKWGIWSKYTVCEEDATAHPYLFTPYSMSFIMDGIPYRTYHANYIGDFGTIHSFKFRSKAACEEAVSSGGPKDLSQVTSITTAFCPPHEYIWTGEPFHLIKWNLDSGQATLFGRLHVPYDTDIAEPIAQGTVTAWH